MGLETTRKRGSSKPAEKPERDSKSGAAKSSSQRNMPGTEDDDDDDLIVTKSAPPPNGVYRARVNRCYFMRYKNGDRVTKKNGDPMPPQLEFIIDDPKEREKMMAHEPHNQLRDVKQGMDLDGNWRRRTNDLCAALGYPESDWKKIIREVKGKKIENLKFPMHELDALSEKDEHGKYKYFLITVETKSGEDANKGTPFTNITKIEPWVEKAPKKGKKKKDDPEPEPEETDESETSDESEEETDEDDETEGGSEEQPDSTGDPDDDIPF